MRIVRKFKQLTSFTYPFGTESDLEKYLPVGFQKDDWGNYFYKVDGDLSTMFTCHLDTSCIYKEKVNHIFDGNVIRTDGTTILGADDKAGMVILLYMIENSVPGIYYFFVGEERGCVGSSKLSANWNFSEFSKTVKKIISFDRRGTDSIITEQLYGVCCSNEFALELAQRLNYSNQIFNFKPDPTGIYTDSAQFTKLVPECTNISVGYYNEHSTSEYQNIDFLKSLCKSVCEIDWKTLPIKRFGLSDFDEESELKDDSYEYKNESVAEQEQFELDDEWSNRYYSYFYVNGTQSIMYVSDSRVKEETEIIRNWVNNTSEKKLIYYFEHSFLNKDIFWDGDLLYIVDENAKSVLERLTYLTNRSKLSELIPDLKFVKIKHLKSWS
jgi:hypothetical protein